MIHVPHLVFIFFYLSISFFLVFILTPFFLKLMTKMHMGKMIRENAVDGSVAKIFRSLHLKKEGTPSMGGVLIWGGVALVVFFSRALSFFGIIEQSLLNRGQTYLPLFTLLTVGLLGLFDDYLNSKGKINKGITAKVKMAWLFLFSAMGSFWFYFKLDYNSIHIPRLGDFHIGWLYIPLFILVIIASSNAVNITDGLDGLAGGLLLIAFTSFGVIAYFKGLYILAGFCGAVSGALVAFLWFNVPPAKYFMGDTGALSLGATLGVIAMLTNSVFVLPLIGGIFVIETLSVILQLFWKKFFKRKLFLVAPIHHHFEKLKWPEHNVVMRFWIGGGILAVIGLIIGIIGMGIEQNLLFY
jgi:phospho-N-acetylmuramoyl-pentapeptide-transferase